MGEEAGHAAHHLPGRDRIIQHHHGAGAKRGANLTQRLPVESDVEVRSADERAGRAAQQHVGDAAIGQRPAGLIEQQMAQGASQRQFVKSRALHTAADAKELGAWRLRGAVLAQPAGAVAHDGRDVEEGLDVVDDRRFAEEACLHWKRRLDAGHAALALDGLEECGLFAADVRACAQAQFDVEVQIAAQQMATQVAGFSTAGQRILQHRRRVGILAAQVDVTAHLALALNRVRGQRHRLDQPEGIALQQRTIFEGAGLALVRVAHDHLGCRRLIRGAAPFDPGGKSRAPAAHEA